MLLLTLQVYWELVEREVMEELQTYRHNPEELEKIRDRLAEFVQHLEELSARLEKPE